MWRTCRCRFRSCENRTGGTRFGGAAFDSETTRHPTWDSTGRRSFLFEDFEARSAPSSFADARSRSIQWGGSSSRARSRASGSRKAFKQDGRIARANSRTTGSRRYVRTARPRSSSSKDWRVMHPRARFAMRVFRRTCVLSKHPRAARASACVRRWFDAVSPISFGPRTRSMRLCSARIRSSGDRPAVRPLCANAIPRPRKWTF